MSDELTKLSAARLLHLMKSRDVSPVETLRALQERIEKINPQINAIVTLNPNAHEQASALEQRLMRDDAEPLPLHGLPVTIKDTIETKGLLTTSGSKRRSDHVPQIDAPAVARLKAAGAIILGKTNVSEMAVAYSAENPVYGRAMNPYDFERTPGGSSGGEASAISACLSPAGLGSDLSGSIRIPAHFCGIFGLKPTTPGLLPASGHFPANDGPLSLGAAIGPMARSAADLSLLWNALVNVSSIHSRESFSPSYAARELRGCRVACYWDDLCSPVSAEVRVAVESAAQALAAAGLQVSNERPPGVERGPQLWLELFGWRAARNITDAYHGHEGEAGEIVRAVIARAQKREPPAFERFMEAWRERDHLLSNLLLWMNARASLLVAPVGSVAAFPHTARKASVSGKDITLFQAFGYSQTFNVFGLPSVCVPVAQTSEGLPVGVQVIGRPFCESEVLAAARVLEESHGGWKPSALFTY